jgi:hypothetical protein
MSGVSITFHGDNFDDALVKLVTTVGQMTSRGQQIMNAVPPTATEPVKPALVTTAEEGKPRADKSPDPTPTRFRRGGNFRRENSKTQAQGAEAETGGAAAGEQEAAPAAGGPAVSVSAPAGPEAVALAPSLPLYDQVKADALLYAEKFGGLALRKLNESFAVKRLAELPAVSLPAYYERLKEKMNPAGALEDML